MAKWHCDVPSGALGTRRARWAQRGRDARGHTPACSHGLQWPAGCLPALGRRHGQQQTVRLKPAASSTVVEASVKPLASRGGWVACRNRGLSAGAARMPAARHFPHPMFLRARKWRPSRCEYPEGYAHRCSNDTPADELFGRIRLAGLPASRPALASAAAAGFQRRARPIRHSERAQKAAAHANRTRRRQSL